ARGVILSEVKRSEMQSKDPANYLGCIYQRRTSRVACGVLRLRCAPLRMTSASVLRSCLTLAALVSFTGFAQPSPAPESAKIVVETHVQPKPPLFFSATAEHVVRLGVKEISGEIKL